MSLIVLEEKIMNAWNTVEEIDTICSAFMDSSNPPSEDTLANMLIGVRDLHDARMQDLMDYFELKYAELHKNAAVSEVK